MVTVVATVAAGIDTVAAVDTLGGGGCGSGGGGGGGVSCLKVRASNCLILCRYCLMLRRHSLVLRHVGSKLGNPRSHPGSTAARICRPSLLKYLEVL
jgi:hypothetical protein